MGVPCPGCGRSYDAALFQFGRTIDCRCGCRVGLEPRVRQLTPGARPRFMVDAMLGRLARWLRILGFDAAWEAHIADEALVRRALEEDRIILTRDQRLPSEWRAPNITLVGAEEPRAQLAEVARRFGLAESARPFTRCSRCNVALTEVPRSAARGHVPARVLEDHDRFQGCPSCGRIYWPGSHHRRMLEVLERALAEPSEPCS